MTDKQNGITNYAYNCIDYVKTEEIIISYLMHVYTIWKQKWIYE